MTLVLFSAIRLHVIYEFFQFTSKLQKEMLELRNEWMERRKELEQKVNERMEQCRQLGNSLIEATEDVKQKNKNISEKEKNLEITRLELESRYLKMLTGLLQISN